MLTISAVSGIAFRALPIEKAKKIDESAPDLQERQENLIPATGYREIVNYGDIYDRRPLNKAERMQVLEFLNTVDKKDAKHGSSGEVYRIKLSSRQKPMAVKFYTDINEGRNPQKEATSLQKLPNDCLRVQHYVDIINDNDKYYLVSTFMPGNSLADLKDKMSDKVIGNILDELYKIERNGIAYYDYSMANIVTEGEEPRFFDFEDVKEQSFTVLNNDAENDLCHMARNTYFPKITNPAAFEIRTVGKIIGELEKYPDGEERSTDFVRRYLKQISKFYQKTSELYAQNAEIPGSQMNKDAVRYEQILAKLFANPSDEIVKIEKQHMRIRELLTEYFYRNDKNLEHDDKLYNDLPRYIKNMEERFYYVQEDLYRLKTKSNDNDVKEYCDVTSKYLEKLQNKEVSYLRRKAALEQNS